MERQRRSECYPSGVIRIWYSGPKGEDLDKNEADFELYTQQSHVDDSSLLHSFTLDTSQTEVIESDLGLKFRVPPFSASADVYVPRLPETTALQVGWIVACSKLSFVNKYGGYGETRWELPHQMANATIGTSYPWYGNNYEAANVVGQKDGDSGWTKVTVSMFCYTSPQVQWRLDLTTADGVKPGLTNVKRSQENIAWLAVKNITTGSVYILKTLTWEWVHEFRVDVTAPLGRRTRLLVDRREHPIMHEKNLIIPEETFYPPNMHYASTLTWFPYGLQRDIKPTDDRRESIVLKVGSVAELPA